MESRGRHFDTGAVVALVNYMSQILVGLIKLADLIINITKAVACGTVSRSSRSRAVYGKWKQRVH